MGVVTSNLANYKRKYRGNEKRINTQLLWNGKKQTAHFIANKGQFQHELDKQVRDEYGDPFPTTELDCQTCNDRSCFEYSDQYDTHYCLVCGGSYEKKCSDATCEYCVGREE